MTLHCGLSLYLWHQPVPLACVHHVLQPGAEPGGGAGEGAGAGAGEGAGGAKGGGGARLVECAASAVAPRALSLESSESASSADCSVADVAASSPSPQSAVSQLSHSQHLGPTTAQSAVQPAAPVLGPGARPRRREGATGRTNGGAGGRGDQ